MSNYKTPGVYVEEISKFPPSVAGVATAIPAFIGFTEKPRVDDKKPVRIKSLVDFEEKFGKGMPLTINEGKLVGADFCLYDSLRLFYDNGGGICYVYSVGTYKAFNEDLDLGELYKNALEPLNKVDEVTLIALPDASCLLKDKPAVLGSIQSAILAHCASRKDRFAILDPILDTDFNDALEKFRFNVGNNNLSYGAAYYPYVKTTYSKEIAFDEMKKLSGLIKDDENLECYNQSVLDVVKTNATDEEKALVEKFEYDKDTNVIKYDSKEINRIEDLDESVEGLKDDDYVNKAKIYNSILSEIAKKTLLAKAIIASNPDYTNKLKELQEEASIIPVSGAIAGIYSAVDASKGVWQAPANVSISSVADVTDLLSDKDQELLNVDANTGKSVNAIRVFSGKGILVWGARTLDGNSNEWRYISVRRLFNYVEESVQKATAWAVFQPNDANTWMKVQSQIENFLSNLWRDGALAGSTPDKAYYVKIGLNVTMTANDINEGNMIVEIGMAAVRPAEFIVLQFSHKVQEA